MSERKFSRRDFLKVSAVTTASVALAACTPPPAPQAGAGGAQAPAKQGIKLNFFNRGGEYVFKTMDLQIAEFKKNPSRV